MKNFIIALVIIVTLLGVGFVFLKPNFFNNEVVVTNVSPTSKSTTNDVVTPPAVTPTVKATATNKGEEVIGTSVGGRNITAYHFGNGIKEILFIGGAHGGYEWNTTLVAYQLMDYLKANPSSVPSSVRVTVIPVLNPDGLFKVFGTADRVTPASAPQLASTIPGRYNANNVDLNRNFDSNWNGTGSSADPSRYDFCGSSAFSEPETRVIKTFMDAHAKDYNIQAYLSLHSFSQHYMFPYGHTAEKDKNNDDLMKMGAAAVQAIVVFNFFGSVSIRKHVKL